MNREKLALLQTYARDMAALLYEEAQATVPEELKTLPGIEATIRRQWLQYVGPEIALFLSKAAVVPLPDEPEL